jgi:DHA1 family bicyclomycin/chloramphenicol resistance-like MFS transporter
MATASLAFRHCGTRMRCGVTPGIHRMILIGTLVSVTGLLIDYGFIVNGCLTPIRLFMSICIAIVSNGNTTPNTQAAAINAFPNLARSASGLTGFFQMLFSAVSSRLVKSFLKVRVI